MTIKKVLIKSPKKPALITEQVTVVVELEKVSGICFVMVISDDEMAGKLIKLFTFQIIVPVFG